MAFLSFLCQAPSRSTPPRPIHLSSLSAGADRTWSGAFSRPKLAEALASRWLVETLGSNGNIAREAWRSLRRWCTAARGNDSLFVINAICTADALRPAEGSRAGRYLVSNGFFLGEPRGAAKISEFESPAKADPPIQYASGGTAASTI